MKEMIVDIVRERVYDLLDSLGEESFDYSHVRHVEANCIELAKLRGLDMNIAAIIALLHDIGRIQDDAWEESHGKAGSRIAKNWLDNLGVSEDLRKTVVKAVRNHSRKGRIGSPYEELIKDSDALAHEEEFLGDIEFYEEIRCRNARGCREGFAVNLDVKIDEVYMKLQFKLFELLDRLDEEGVDDEVVHDVRVTIRKIRSLLWLLSEKALSRQYKEMFKVFEDPRKYSVLRMSLKKSGLKKGDYKILDKLIAQENSNMLASLLAANWSKEVFAFQHEFTDYENNVAKAVAEKVKLYKEFLEKMDARNIEDLHQLRIWGKKWKYLIECDLVHIDEETYEVIKELHKILGQIHDTFENRSLLELFDKNGVMKMKKTKKKDYFRYLKRCEKEQREKSKDLVFYIRKRFI